MRCHRQPQSAGFTLVELTVVLVLVAVLGLVFGPRLIERRPYDELGYYQEVVAAARYAKRFAVASGCEVMWATTPNGYALYQRQTGCQAGAFTRVVEHPTRGEPFSGVSPDRISFSSVPASVVFDPLGRASANAVVTVENRSFTIVAQTGYVVTP